MSFQVQYVTYNLLYQLNDDDDDDDNGGGDGEGDGDDDDDDDDDEEEEEEEEEDENCTSEKIKSHHLHLPTLFYFRMAKKTYGVNILTLTKSCLLASP